MLTVAYLRTSHDRDDNYSISFQEKDIRKYCTQHGIYLDKVFPEDYPGYTLERPQLQELIQLILTGNVQRILIWRIDRLSRTKHHAQWILGEYILPHHIELHVTEKNTIIRDDLSSKIIFDIDAASSEEERLAIRKRTMRGRLEKLERGEWLGQGTLIYGFEKQGNKKETYIQIHPEEREVVIHIYQSLASGVRPIDIAKDLNIRGILSPAKSRGRKNATSWDTNNIRKLVQDTRYKGEWYQLRYKQEQRVINKRDKEEWVLFNGPAIVDSLLWERANTRITERKNKWSFTPKRDYLLHNGRGTCICGATITSRTQNNGRYQYPMYICSDRHKGKSSCPFCLKSEAFDVILWSFLKEFLSNPQFSKDVLASDTPMLTTRIDDTAIERIRKEYIDSVDRYYTDYEKGLLPAELYTQRKQALDERLENAEKLHREYKAKYKAERMTDDMLTTLTEDTQTLAGAIEALPEIPYILQHYVIEQLDITCVFSPDDICNVFAYDIPIGTFELPQDIKYTRRTS